MASGTGRRPRKGCETIPDGFSCTPRCHENGGGGLERRPPPGGLAGGRGCSAGVSSGLGALRGCGPAGRVPTGVGCCKPGGSSGLAALRDCGPAGPRADQRSAFQADSATALSGGGRCKAGVSLGLGGPRALRAFGPLCRPEVGVPSRRRHCAEWRWVLQGGGVIGTWRPTRFAGLRPAVPTRGRRSKPAAPPR